MKDGTVFELDIGLARKAPFLSRRRCDGLNCDRLLPRAELNWSDGGCCGQCWGRDGGGGCQADKADETSNEAGETHGEAGGFGFGAVPNLVQSEQT